MRVADPTEVAKAVRFARAGRHLLLLCDVDGTLCEVQSGPSGVSLSTERQALLQRLAVREATTVGIISGRRLADVARLTRLPATVFHAGVHGLEIEGAGEHFLHPEASAARSALHHAAQRLSLQVERFPGAFVEDKDISIVVHFRDTSREGKSEIPLIVERLTRDAVAADHLRVMRGLDALELLPGVVWNKGSAVSWIRGRIEPACGTVCPVFFGDDVTDEDAFLAVRGDGVAVAASDRVSGADFRVDGPAGVEEVLRLLGKD